MVDRFHGGCSGPVTESGNHPEQSVPRWHWGIGVQPRTEPPDPPGFCRVVYERIPLQRLSLISLATIPVWAVFFGVLIILIGAPDAFAVTIQFQDILLVFAIVLIGVPVVHEAVHGLVAWLLGLRPSYGVGLGFAYTTFRDPVSRSGYILVSLTPLVLISVVGLALVPVWPFGLGHLLVFLVVNAVGAIGDIWVAWRTWSLPAGVRIYDLADGYAVYLPEESAPAR